MKTDNSVIYSIRWDNLACDTYLYGSSIVFGSGGTVKFSNLIMPPGQVIRKWQSDVNYQVAKHEPQLPVLEEGEEYEIRSYVRYKPEGSVKLRFKFYDRQGEDAGKVIIDGITDEFVCPDGASSYELELINAGAKELVFHHIEIQKKSGAERNIRIIDRNSDSNLCILVLEPTGSSYILPQERILIRFRNRVILTCEGADAIELNSSGADELLNEIDPRRISVIGYGTRSNESAAKLANHIGSQVKLYTYGNPQKKVAKGVENFVYGNEKKGYSNTAPSLMDPLNDKSNRLFTIRFT